jgi:hypothetical protein
MYYTVYKTTNKMNGKVYIGSHKTRNLDDKYMGSGKYLLSAIKKHGLSNFTKEVLFVFDNPEDMYAKEAELVNDEFLSEANTYNLKKGGFGGFDYVNSTNKNLYGANGINGKEALKKARTIKKQLIDDNPQFIKDMNKRVSDALISHYETNPGNFTGKTHSQSTKEKIGQKNCLLQKGSKNSQFGTMWIHNGQTSKKIKKIDGTPEGWTSGRIKK